MTGSRPSGSLPAAKAPLAWLIVGLSLADAGLLAGLGWVMVRKGDVNWSGGFAVQAEGPDAPPVVAAVNEGGPVAGLLWPGDTIRTIDGDPRVTFSTLTLFGRSLAAGARVEIERSRERRTLQLPPLRVSRPDERWRGLLLYAPAACSLLLVGSLVGGLRSRQRSALLFALAALAAAPPMLRRAIPPLSTGVLEPWEEWLSIAGHLPSPVHLVLALAFLFEFPERPVLGPRWLLGRRLVGVLGLVVWCVSVLSDVAASAALRLDITLAWGRPLLWRTANRAVDLYPALALGFMVLVVLAKYRGTAALSGRQRMNWMLLCIALGLLPNVLYFALRAGLAITGRPAGSISWLSGLGGLALTVLPLGVGYAVVRHQAFDIRVVIRRGLRYLLARGVLRLAVLAPALLIGVEILRDPSQPVGDLVLRRPAVWVALGAALVLLYRRRRLMAWLDRRFFRTPYDPESVLLSLLQDVSSRESPEDLAGAVAARIQAALHPQSVHVLLRDDDTGRLERRYGSGDAPSDAVLGHESSLVQLAERLGRPVPLPHPELAGDASVPSRTEAVAVPIGGGTRPLLGLLLLGAKLSEEAYSAKDLQLLEAIAGQLVIAHENASLRRRVSDERRVREQVLARLDDQGVNLVQECPACGTCFDRTERSCPAHGPVLTLSLPVERTVDRRWRLERRLGRGGMGTVFEASDLRLPRRVALKLMHSGALDSGASRRRFEREARVLARLQHPHLVTLLDFGEAGAAGAYLVMELISGPTLREVLSPGVPLPPPAVAGWFDQVGDAVAFAHRAGVIHRDLKPENVVLTGTADGPVAKVLDFGLARLRLPGQVGSGSLTETGAVLGTLAYMAPEQLLGLRADERADVFALGVILAESLTGRHPFRHDEADRTIAAILGDAVSLHGQSPDIRAIERVLQEAMAKDRERRLASVDELRTRVVPLLRTCPTLPAAAPAPPLHDAPTATLPARHAGPTLPGPDHPHR